FSGAALLTHILADISLPLALSLFAALLLLAVLSILRRASGPDRSRIARIAAVAAVTGISATLLYDGTKALLSLLDPTPYNPFEAASAFGRALLGAAAPPAAIQVTGWAFHLLNGTCFGIAFGFLFAREGRTSAVYALLTGMGWGLFLELFQLTLYPGWLDIRFYEEFARISAVSHLVYGATLGVACRLGLRVALSAEGLV
ncbi:MAG: hypothetical protein ACRD1T_27250, partial [Acidimicrobiia bacterium]